MEEIRALSELGNFLWGAFIGLTALVCFPVFMAFCYGIARGVWKGIKQARAK